jgi:hypothetical protein
MRSKLANWRENPGAVEALRTKEASPRFAAERLNQRGQDTVFSSTLSTTSLSISYS